MRDIKAVHEDARQLRHSCSLYEYGGESLNTSRTMTSLNMLGYGSCTKRLIVNLIRDACVRVEMKCGDHTDLTLEFLLRLSKHYMRMTAADEAESNNMIANIETAVEACTDIIHDSTLPCDITNAVSLIQAHMPQQRAASIVMEATKLAGVTGKINVKKTPDATRTCIELISGYSFELEPVISLNSVDPWRRRDVKCLVIDGIIESVSEFDKILRYCNENGESLVVFARGFGQEVSSTIAANRIRGTLDVHPMIVSFDAKKANVLNDLAIIAGCDVISSLKGELIETIDPRSLTSVGVVRIVGSNVLLENSRTVEHVMQHITFLERTRDELEDGDPRREIYDERIRSLLGLHVDVFVGGSPRTAQHDAESIDSGLRFMRSLINGGIIDHKKLIECLQSNSITSLLADSIKSKLSEDQISSDLVIQVLRAGTAYVKNVFGASGVIITDQSQSRF